MKFTMEKGVEMERLVEAKDAEPGVLYQVVEDEGYKDYIVLIFGTEDCKGMSSLNNQASWWCNLDKNTLKLKRLPKGTVITLEQDR